jgi:glycerate 2-kinase
LTNTIVARLRNDAVAILRAAVAAADPTELVAGHLERCADAVLVTAAGSPVGRWRAPTLIVGAGKAAAGMAAGCERVLGAENVAGEVIVAAGCAVELKSVAVAEAGHPLPDARGESAARRIMQRVRESRAGGILCLISGGASSLLVCPRAPLGVHDKIETTRLLLACGADIRELNTVRKHLSEVKGGGLLRAAHVSMAALLISDVVGDDPGTIGSGPTAPDATTFADAWAVLERYGLVRRAPARIVELLRNGMDGRIAETVKPHSSEAGRCRNVIIGSNRIALEGAAKAARACGWVAHALDEPVIGDTTQAARRFASRVGEIARSRTAGQPLCVLAGGETTVRVRGKGRGGRNQEFALAVAAEIAGLEMVVLSAGTDGIDGPTDAAGAFVDGTTTQRAAARGLSPDTALLDNDSYTFFAQLGDLYTCGPTGTNVMDIKIALLPSADQVAPANPL